MTELEEKANGVCREVLEMCTRTGEGRLASAFSCIEILVTLFYGGIPPGKLWCRRLEVKCH